MQADRLDHLSKLPVSIFNTDAKLGNDGQYPAALSSSLTFPPPAATASSSPSFTPPSRPFASFDQAACIMSLPSEATTDDPLSTLRDQEVVNLREVFFALAIDPSTLKAETKHCVTALRQLKLVKSEIELERVLRISGMLPQYRRSVQPAR